MITGKKPAGSYEDEADAAPLARPILRAVLLLGLAATLVIGGIVVAGGKLP
jgi:hypothetical protein